MAGRRFHRTTEMIPHRPWKAKSPFAFGSKPIKISINKGTLGVRVRYDAVLLPFMSIVRRPGRPVIWVPDKNRTQTPFSQTFQALPGSPGKIPDIPPKKFDFPGFEGHIELFGPHPFTWKTGSPTPPDNIRTQKLGFVLFSRAWFSTYSWQL